MRTGTYVIPILQLFSSITLFLSCASFLMKSWIFRYMRGHSYLHPYSFILKKNPMQRRNEPNSSFNVHRHIEASRSWDVFGFGKEDSHGNNRSQS